MKYCITLNNEIPLLQLIVTTDGSKDNINP